MEEMEIDPILIAWVRNFLTGRKQRVRIRKCFYSMETANGGVPQRTVLGPLLFLIMINDLQTNYRDRWKFVDDSTLSETLTRDQLFSLQSILDDINQWCGENDILLNIKKCKELLVCFWENKPYLRYNYAQ